MYIFHTLRYVFKIIEKNIAVSLYHKSGAHDFTEDANTFKLSVSSAFIRKIQSRFMQ